VSFFESVVRDHSKDHPMTVAVYDTDTLTGEPYTTLLDSTLRGELLRHSDILPEGLRPS